MVCLGKKKETSDEVAAVTEKMREEYEGVPIDIGWGWVISVCVCLNLTIIIGYNRAMSVLFVDVTEEFDQSATVVSLLFTISAVTACFSTIITSNVFMVHYSVRQITVAAALCNALGTFAVSQAPNIALFLVLNVVKGAAFGCLLVCPISLIGYYFKKKRNLALSIASSGFCAAFIVLPPITEKLRFEYGLRGCLLLLSALELHLVAINMLLRSPGSYKKLYRLQRNAQSNQSSQIKPLLCTKDPVSEMDADHSENPPNHGDCESIHMIPIKNDKTDFEGQFINESEQNCPKMNPKPIEKDGKSHGMPREPKEGGVNTDLNHGGQTAGENVASMNDASKREEVLDSSHIPPSRNKHLKTLSTNLINDFSLRGSQYNLSAPDDFLYCDASYTSLPNISVGKVNGKKEEVRSQGIEGGTIVTTGCSSCIGKLFDLSLFKNWLFRMMAVYVPASAALNFLIIYMPVIALNAGVARKDAALYMTISGVMDLITRIVIGFIADISCVTKPKMVIGSLLVMTTLCHTSRFFLNKDTFLLFAIVVGIFGGFRQNLLVSMITDYVGVERMAKGYAACSMLTTLFLSSNHPILGAMLDATGNFFLPLNYLGMCLFIALVTLACEPFFAFMERKRQERIAEYQSTSLVGSSHSKASTEEVAGTHP